MTPEELKHRTKRFALRCVKLASSFPPGALGETVSRQLIRCATSVAANYRAACSARSHADFLNKLGIVEEEADECAFWIEFSVDSGLVPCKRVEELVGEAEEIRAIVIASEKTAKSRRKEGATVRKGHARMREKMPDGTS